MLLKQKKPVRRRDTATHLEHALAAEAFNMEDMVLPKVMKPMYISMACLGLLWTNGNKWFRGIRCSFDLFTLHCCITQFLAWFWALKYIAYYDSSAKFGSRLFLRLGPHFYAVQMALGITIHIIYKQRHIPALFKLWENYKLKHGGITLSFMKRQVFLRVAVVNICLIIIFLGCVILFVVDPQEQFVQMFQIIMYFPKNMQFALMVIAILIHNYLSLAWLQSIIFTTCLNLLLREEFRQFTEEFSEMIKHEKSSSDNHVNLKPFHEKTDGKSNTRANQIEPYRQRHYDLCRLVRRFDDAASVYLLVLYLFSIPMIVLGIYAMIGLEKGYAYESATSFFFYLTSLAFFIIILLTITISSARLAAAVSNKFYAKHFTQKKKRSQNGSSEVLFLSVEQTPLWHYFGSSFF